MVLKVSAWYEQCKILEKYFPYLWQFYRGQWVHLLEICIFLGWFWRFSGLKLWIIVWSLKFMTFWVWKCWKFVLFVDFWMSSLPGVTNWNGGAEFCSLLLLERCKIHGKYTCNFEQFGQFWSISQTHWKSKLVHCEDFWSESALLSILKLLIGLRH